jgi:hypothetical protein
VTLQEVEQKVMVLLAQPLHDRQDEDINFAWKFFQDRPFFKRLWSKRGAC